MEEVIFTSVCFGDARYFEQMDRLKASILSFYPESQIMFFRGSYPPGSRDFYHSLYGFKPHAIAAAKEKAKKVIWLDPAMIMVDTIESILNFPMLAVMDDNPLYNVVSDRCYEYFKIKKETVHEKAWHLVGGSIYIFDFDNEKTNLIFHEWLIAEKQGIFGSQEEQASERLQGHRMDEAVLAMCMYLNGVNPISAEEARYCWAKKPVFDKKHFK